MSSVNSLHTAGGLYMEEWKQQGS